LTGEGTRNQKVAIQEDGYGAGSITRREQAEERSSRRRRDIRITRGLDWKKEMAP
jgi:hypothetical protein